MPRVQPYPQPQLQPQRRLRNHLFSKRSVSSVSSPSKNNQLPANQEANLYDKMYCIQLFAQAMSLVSGRKCVKVIINSYHKLKTTRHKKCITIHHSLGALLLFIKHVLRVFTVWISKNPAHIRDKCWVLTFHVYSTWILPNHLYLILFFIDLFILRLRKSGLRVVTLLGG